jgi:exopolysaccharide biosynthesis protein
MLLIFVVGCSPLHKLSNQAPGVAKDPIPVIHINTDTLFNSNQRLSLLMLSKKSLDRYTIDIGYSDHALISTSKIAARHDAVAAINGSFFDRDGGGSVTYLEKNGAVVSNTRPAEMKWALPDDLITGAIILTKNHKFIIQKAKADHFYEQSKRETFVMVSGPLLIRNSKVQELPNMNFTNKRHPRTCLCTKKEAIIFLTVDGRQEQADGMSLLETQQYLLELGCIDAVNLDGGGSTTLWTKENGVENMPSDKNGERPVANAILILKNH